MTSGTSTTLVADFDDVLVTRASWLGHLNDGGGDFELSFVLVNSRRGDRFERFEVFDREDDPGWGARLCELLGERGAALAIGVRTLVPLRDRDWQAMLERYTSDVVQIDRRKVGGGEVPGAQGIVDFYRGLIELVPDLRPHLVRVLDVAPNANLVRLDVRGHAVRGRRDRGSLPAANPRAR